MTAVTEANPTVARRRLALYFRKLRERHELGLDKLSAILRVAPSQASRCGSPCPGTMTSAGS